MLGSAIQRRLNFFFLWLEVRRTSHSEPGVTAVSPSPATWQVGAFRLDPRSGELLGPDGGRQRLPPKVLEVLLCLIHARGALVSKTDLLDRVWADSPSGEEVLSKAIWSLRRAFGENARAAAYIETLPKRGYRLVAACAPIDADATASDATPAEAEARSATAPPTSAPPLVARSTRLVPRRWIAFGLVFALALVAWWVLSRPDSNPPREGWTLRLAAPVWNAPVLADGVLFVASKNGLLQAVDAGSGALRWQVALGGAVVGSPLVIGDDLLASTADGWWHARARDSGRERWRLPLPAQPSAAPCLAHGRAWQALADGSLFWVDPATPSRRGRVHVDGGPIRALLSAPGHLLAITDGGSRELDASGRTRWSSPLGALPAFAGIGGGRLWLAEGVRLRSLALKDGAAREEPALPAHVAALTSDGASLWAIDEQSGLFAIDDSGATRPMLATTPAQDVLPAFHRGGWLLADASGVLWLGTSGAPARAVVRAPTTVTALALDSDRVYYATVDGSLHASMRSHLLRALPHASARERWRIDTVGAVTASAAMAGNRVHVADGAFLRALEFDSGTLAWRAALPGEVSGGVLRLGSEADTRLFVGDRSGKLSAFRGDGHRLWQRDLGAPLRATPVAADDASLLIGDERGLLHRLRSEDGRELWTYAVQGPIHAAVAVADDLVYVGAGDRQVCALDLDTGALRWQVAMNEWVVAAPLVVDADLYVADASGRVLSIDRSSGNTRWQASVTGEVWHGLAADATRLFVGSGDGHLYALDRRDGRELWRVQTDDRVLTQPVLWRGLVAFSSHDGWVRIVDANDGSVCDRLATRASGYNVAIEGDLLVVGSLDQAVRAFDLGPSPCRDRGQR